MKQITRPSSKGRVKAEKLIEQIKNSITIKNKNKV
jgi:hypothetical protein